MTYTTPDYLQSTDLTDRMYELMEMHDKQIDETEIEGIKYTDEEIAAIFTEDDYAELEALQAIHDECSGYGDFDDGTTLIRDTVMDTYLAEQMEEVYPAFFEDVPDCLYVEIDYDALKADYITVEFKGSTYWILAL